MKTACHACVRRSLSPLRLCIYPAPDCSKIGQRLGCCLEIAYNLHDVFFLGGAEQVDELTISVTIRLKVTYAFLQALYRGAFVSAR